MKKIRKLIMSTALVTAMAITVSACGMVERTQESIDGTVLATVGSVNITQKDLTEESKSYLDSLKSQYGEEALATEEGKKVVSQLKVDLLNALVEMEILNIKADEMGIAKDSEEVTKAVDERITTIKTIYGGDDAKYLEGLTSMGYTEESYKAFVQEEVRRGMLYEELVKDVTTSDEDALAYYNENKATYTDKAGATIFHIYFGTDEASKAAADEAMAKIKGGADFAATAAEYGKDSTATEGGELGYFAYDTTELYADFMDKVKPLKEGEISEVVQSTAGYHIIKVTGVKPVDILKPFEEVKDEVTEEVLAAKKNEAYAAKMETWKEELKVKTFEDKIV